MFDLVPIFIHRQEFDRAAVDFEQNPTAENEARLHGEQDKNQSLRNEIRILEAITLFAAGLICYGIYLIARHALGFHETAESANSPSSPTRKG
jgi:hypothetical protein